MKLEILGFFFTLSINEILSRPPRNVALGRHYDFVCKPGRDKRYSITDGNLGTGHIFPEDCNTNQVWVKISFKQPALVYEVVVTLGACATCSAGVINQFVGSLRGSQFPKGAVTQTYPHHSTIGKPMRMSFAIAHGKFAEGFHFENNKVKPLSNKNVKIMEIQIWEYNVSDRIYMGCYIPFEAYTIHNYPSKYCKWMCTKKMYRLFTFHLTTCKCMDILFGEPKLYVACGRICKNDITLFCPNLTTNVPEQGVAIFLAHPAIPQYIGCYGTYDTLNKTTRSVGSPVQCINECTKLRRLYAAIKGSECFCTDIIVQNQVADEVLCSTTCTSENYKICGGETTYSIYSSFYGGIYHASYQSIYQCNGEYDETGHCVSGCKSKFQGDRCNELYIRGSTDIPYEHFGSNQVIVERSQFWILIGLVAFTLSSILI